MGNTVGPLYIESAVGHKECFILELSLCACVLS